MILLHPFAFMPSSNLPGMTHVPVGDQPKDIDTQIETIYRENIASAGTGYWLFVRCIYRCFHVSF